MVNVIIVRNDNIFQMPDGRQLGYAEYGEPGGYPVFLFHGTPSSRLSWGHFPGCPFVTGIHIIAPDRPGYGLTDFKPQALESWPDDIRILADHLEIDKFAVMGVSGGAPYALACAWKIPERLTAVGLVSSVGPKVPEAIEGVIKPLRLLWDAAGPLFGLIEFQMRMMGLIAKCDPEKVMNRLRVIMRLVMHKKIFDRPEIRKIFIKDFPEAYRRNGIGPAYDTTIPGNWPIPLEQIKMKVHLWNTEPDHLVGRMGHYMARKLPNCEARYISDADHLWILDHMEEVLTTLLSRWNLGSDNRGEAGIV